MKLHRSFVLALLITTGCATGIALTSRGTEVQTVGRADLPDGCRFLGDVSIGIPPDAARPVTEEQLAILMRNKAGDMGGNHVIVEFSEHRAGTGTGHFVGGGSAYACTAVATTGQTGPTETTEGGEETTGEEPMDESL